MDNRMYELCSGWYIVKDAENKGIDEGWENAVREDAVPAFVPSIIQQFFPEYHGLAYYWCKFKPSLSLNVGDRCLLKFGAVDYKADVWLNGMVLGSHEGGEAPFDFDITEFIKNGEENLLCVRVLNTCDKTIDGLNLLNTPHRNKSVKKSAGSSLNHGGIWYGVSLEVLPAVYVKDVFFIPEFSSGEVKAEVEIFSSVLSEGQAEITLKIRDKAYDSGEVAYAVKLIELGNGITKCEINTMVHGFKAWDVDSPNLYIAELTVKTRFGEHCISKKIGFREFHTEKGYFYLNGKRIYLKSAHTGNAFPVGQMLPVRPEHMQKDMIYAKSCGFNMLRAISGVFRPEQLDLADEIGLLIFEECFASWCVGNSQMCDWNDEESYAEANHKFPETPLGDERAMLARWRKCTEDMIIRDRSHPSIVIWGLLNETRNNGVFREAVNFLGRARELDPTRFIALNGGRFDYDMSIGSGSNPHSNEWEHTWGYDGDTKIVPWAIEKNKNKNWYMGDNHYYASCPMNDFDINLYREFGTQDKAVFLSEFGIGPLFNVIDEYRHFKQYGERLDLEDCSWLEAQSNAFERDFNRLGLAKIFAFPERLLKESQKNNALERRQIFDVIRSNPRISGYSLTGLLDHGMCGEGLWTYWRHWKPEMYDAVSNGWEPLRFCLFVAPNSYSDAPVEIEAVLTNEGILKNGEYTVNAAIIGGHGTVYSCTKKFMLDENEFAVPVLKEKLELGLPKGKYKFVVELEEAAPRSGEIDFTVRDRKDNYVGNTAVSVVGIEEKAKKYLSDIGVECLEWANKDCAVLLVGNVDTETVRRAIDAAERGASVFFLAKESFTDSNCGAIDQAKRVIGDIKRVYYNDWLYHKEAVLLNRDVFDGMGEGLALLRDFEGIFPRYVFRTEELPDYPICPAFQTGYFAVEGAYMLAYGMLGQNFGKGRVFFSAMDVLSNLGKPNADKLLSNIVKYLAANK